MPKSTKFEVIIVLPGDENLVFMPLGAVARLREGVRGTGYNYPYQQALCVTTDMAVANKAAIQYMIAANVPDLWRTEADFLTWLEANRLDCRKHGCTLLLQQCPADMKLPVFIRQHVSGEEFYGKEGPAAENDCELPLAAQVLEGPALVIQSTSGGQVMKSETEKTRERNCKLGRELYRVLSHPDSPRHEISPFGPDSTDQYLDIEFDGRCMRLLFEDHGAGD